MERYFERISINPYGTGIMGALLIWIALSLAMARSEKRKRRVHAADLLIAFSVAIPAMLVGARMLWCVANIKEYVDQPLEMLRVDKGGLSLWGGIFGFIAAFAVYMRAHRVNVNRALDSIAPGLLAFIAIARLLEIYTGQGIGKEIATVFLRQKPLAVWDVYGEARYAVYRYEALFAMLLMALLLMDRAYLKSRRRFVAGESFRFALGGYAAFQILFESLRNDDTIILFEFVRISQVISAAVSIALVLYYTKKLMRPRFCWQSLKYPAIAILGVLLIIRQEYKVDETSVNMDLSYLIMLAGVFMVYVPMLLSRNRALPLRAGKRKKKHA